MHLQANPRKSVAPIDHIAVALKQPMHTARRKMHRCGLVRIDCITMGLFNEEPAIERYVILDAITCHVLTDEGADGRTGIHICPVRRGARQGAGT